MRRDPDLWALIMFMLTVPVLGGMILFSWWLR